MAAFLPLLSRVFVREIYSGFIETLCRDKKYSVARTKFRRYFQFFLDLDRAFGVPEEINLASLSERFDTRWLNRWIHPVNYLQNIQVLEPVQDEEIRMLMVDEQVAQLIERQWTFWTAKLLTEFGEYIREIRRRYRNRGWKGTLQRFRPRTILAAFRAAVAFLESLGPEMKETTQIEQVHLDSFLMEKPGYRSPVSFFLHYLTRKRKLFRPLKLERPGSEFSEDAFLKKKRYEELADGWLDPLHPSPKEALVCILLAAFAQSPLRATSLKMTSIREREDGGYRLRLAKVWLDLTPEISGLVRRYLAGRKALALGEDIADNPYLFPRRKYGQPLNHLIVQEYLEKHQLKASQLFTASLCAAYARGVRHPKVLVLGFGISDHTAVKYFNLFQERIVTETGWRLDG